MEKGQITLISVLIMVSIFLFVSSIIWLLNRTIRNKRIPEKCNKAEINTALAFSGLLILSIWLLRFAVGYFVIVVSEDINQQLTPLEEMINSLFAALRTFSLEEEYAEYIINLKSLVSEIIPGGYKGSSVIGFVVVTYASLLNFMAPIVGGAIILEILASIFPKVRLRWSYFNFNRPKYFFSELNPASLALAKSIFYKEKDKNPILIFTDTYVDDEKEKEYELLLEAKKYGAICVRDDLAHVSKTKRGKRAYYLMDKNEFGNFQTLMSLTEDHNIKFVKDSSIYLFVQSDAYFQIEKQINKEFDDERKKDLLKGGEKPVIIPVNGYRNLVHNLFVDVPLYEPLVRKKDNTKLNITILGNGVIGTEAFLSAYWFGQILISGEENNKKTMSECEMTINVISKDTKDVFWSKIDYVNPEIKQTIEVLGEDDEHKNTSKLLEYDEQGNKNKPYCKVRYFQSDVKVGGFWGGNSGEAQEVLESDYFIVALGNDADNISIAGKLRREIGKKHVENMTTSKNTVITYVVFDSELTRTLNKEKRYCTKEKTQADIYMHAFGSLEQVYSCDNIYMSRNSIWAEETGNVYQKTLMENHHIKDNKKRAGGDENGDYTYWANLARASHVKYKVFSLGWIKRSLFDYSTDKIKVFAKEPSRIWNNEDRADEPFDIVTADSYHKDFVKGVFEEYMRIAISNNICSDDKRGQELKNDLELKKHCLAWLEHRRWNAFTRMMGYQQIDFEKVFAATKEQKDMKLKLHSCLVEARRPICLDNDLYIYADFNANGKVDENAAFRSYQDKKLDFLDTVSNHRKQKFLEKSVSDFKMYDYYRYEFDDYLRVDELSELLKTDEAELIAECENGRYKGAVHFKNTCDWFIPFDAVKSKISDMYYKLDKNNLEDKEIIANYLEGKCDDVFEIFGNWYRDK